MDGTCLNISLIYFSLVSIKETHSSNDILFKHTATAWQQAITAECSEVNGFHLPTVICSDADAISQNDILLLSNKKVL